MVTATACCKSELHPLLISSVRDVAERQAVITASYLSWLRGAVAARGQSFDGLPAGYLLELGALAQIAIWEADGIFAYLPSSVPSFDSAAADLQRRTTENASQFVMPESAILARLVLKVFVEQIGWEAPSILQAAVAIDCASEDELVDVVAKLLWSMRHHVIANDPAS